MCLDPVTQETEQRHQQVDACRRGSLRYFSSRPDRCIVVEDAVAGVEGARRAGMRSIGVSRGGKQLPADVVVQSLESLAPDTFEKLLESFPAVTR